MRRPFRSVRRRARTHIGSKSQQSGARSPFDEVVHLLAPAIDVAFEVKLGTQLNASANVPGTFAYTPAAGTVLNPGNGQLLSVLFTPTDNSDYTIRQTVGRNRTRCQTVTGTASSLDQRCRSRSIVRP